MHKGDLFYVVLGGLVFYLTWPSASEAAVLPPALETLFTAPSAWLARQFAPGPVTVDLSATGGWVFVVFLRNFLIEGSVYELWHQVLFGALAGPEVESRRMSKTSPYDGPSSRVWTERAASVAGMAVSSLYEVLIIHLWATERWVLLHASWNPALPMCTWWL